MTATEPITLRTRGGRGAPATARVTRPSAAWRFTRSILIAFAGFALGGVSILIPVVHLVSTWLLPLVGVATAIVLYGQREIIRDVHGTCPACGERVAFDGGVQADDLWEGCPGCREPLRFDLAG